MTDTEAIQRIAELADSLRDHEERIRSYRTSVEELHANVVSLTADAQEKRDAIARLLAELNDRADSIERVQSESRALFERLSQDLAEFGAATAHLPEALGRMEHLAGETDLLARRSEASATQVQDVLEKLGGPEGARRLLTLKDDVEQRYGDLRQQINDVVQDAFTSIGEHAAGQSDAVLRQFDALQDRIRSIQADLDVWMEQEDRKLQSAFRRAFADQVKRVEQVEKVLSERLDKHAAQTVALQIAPVAASLKEEENRRLAGFDSRLDELLSVRSATDERIARLEAAMSVSYGKLKWLPYWQAAAVVAFVVLAVLLALMARRPSATDDQASRTTTSVPADSQQVDMPPGYVWVVASVANGAEADRIRREYAARGCEAAIYPVQVGDESRFRVTVGYPAPTSDRRPNCPGMPAGAWAMHVP